MTANCSVCSALCSESSDLIKCAGSCGREFHLNCVVTKFPDSLKTRDSKKKWFCEECRKTKGTSSASSSKSGEQATTLTKEFMIGLIEAFKKEVFEELKSHSTQFQEFKAALDFFSTKLDESNKAMAEIKTQYKEIQKENEAVKVQNAQLSQKVDALETKVRDLEQYSRRDNIEINGLPETPGENSMSVLQDVGRAIGVEVEPSTIVAVHRVPTYSRTRTPPLIVRFTTRDKRDAWLRNEKKKTLMARDVNRNFPATKVFINEHLTPDNKLRLRQLKEACRELNVKHVWCREGKFFVKKSDGVNAVRVGSVEELRRISWK